MPPSAGRRVWICWKLQLQLLRTAWTQWAGDGCYGDLWDLGSKMFQTLKLSGWWFQIFFYFHPEPWGRFPFWRAYFSNGLVKPPTSYLRNHFFGLIFRAPKFEAVEVYTHVSQKKYQWFDTSSNSFVLKVEKMVSRFAGYSQEMFGWKLSWEAWSKVDTLQ